MLLDERSAADTPYSRSYNPGSLRQLFPLERFRLASQKGGKGRFKYAMSRTTPVSDDTGGITDVDVDTSRSDTPNMKLPLQKMEPALVRQGGGGVRRSHTTSTTRSWLGDPDRDSRDSIELEVERGVKLDDMRNHRARHQALQQGRQSEGGNQRNSLAGQGRSSLPVIGDEESRPQTAASENSEWNPDHPCFPHRNPHVPLDSPLYESTRIIRIRRDFMVNGDLSPAYSNTFPDIIEPYVSEDRFRMVVAHLNEELGRAFDPWNVWNWLDAMLGLLTLWILEDIIGTYIKRRLRELELYLQEQNSELEAAGSQALFIPLRRTGYMNVRDFVLSPPC